MIYWQSPHAGPIAARVAIAGDFLPAGNLHMPAGGWGASARSLAPHIADCEAAIANLESSLDSESLPPRPPAGLGQTVSAPSASLEFLRAIGCTVVGSANNHSFDFGPSGAERTRAAVARAGMIPLGTARTLRAAPDVFLWQGPGGVRVGFWAAAIASRDLASRSSPGVEPASIARARDAIRDLKARGARVSIALLHAGCMRASRPDPAEAERMNQIARAGFNLVAASHSHRISGARRIDAPGESPSFCFYGLGTVVSGYCESSIEREGLVVIAGLTARGDLVRIELRPVLLAESGFGVIPPPQAGRDIIDRFRSLSNEIADGTAARLFYSDVAPGLMRLYARDIRAAIRQSGFRGLAAKARRLRMRHVQRLVRAVIP